MLALASMGNLISMMCLDPNQWPNCFVPMTCFFNITDPIIEMGEMRALAFAPIITPEQVSQFERFAYQTNKDGEYPNIGYP